MRKSDHQHATKNAPLTPKRLRENDTVTVVGLGGVGQALVRPLCLLLMSFAIPLRLLLVDGDEYELTNTSRMLFRAPHDNKAVAMRKELLSFPCVCDSALTLLARPQYVTPDNTDRIVLEYAWLLLCLDNHKTRNLVASAAQERDNITVISGGCDPAGPDNHGTIRRGTFGTVMAMRRENGIAMSPSLIGNLHPEIQNPADLRPDEQHCTDDLQQSPQLLISNVFCAAVMLSAFHLACCDALTWYEANYDLEQATMAPLPIPFAASRH